MAATTTDPSAFNSGSAWRWSIGVLSYSLLIGGVAVKDASPWARSSWGAVPDQARTLTAVFLSGVVCSFLLKPLGRLLLTGGKAIANPVERASERASSVYGLDHGVLNLSLPPTSWWMNMGYWKGQRPPTDFPQACHALCWQVLERAGIISGQGTAQIGRDVRIIDVGFGCGDQTLAVSKLEHVSAYVGITIDRKQYTFAKQRLVVRDPPQPHKSQVGKLPLEKCRIFCADAANPAQWPDEVHDAISALLPPRTIGRHQVSCHPEPECWVFALDTLYHFSPSRTWMFRHANRHLSASIAAFDLLLCDSSTTGQADPWPSETRSPNSNSNMCCSVNMLLLRLVSWAMAAPFSNFLTPDQYRSQLSEAGYSVESIEIVDISEHVFAPLVEFMDHQDRQLQILGRSLGAFRVAKWLFKWWATTGLVRGCIVIARHTGLRADVH